MREQRVRARTSAVRLKRDRERERERERAERCSEGSARTHLRGSPALQAARTRLRPSPRLDLAAPLPNVRARELRAGGRAVEPGAAVGRSNVVLPAEAPVVGTRDAAAPNEDGAGGALGRDAARGLVGCGALEGEDPTTRRVDLARHGVDKRRSGLALQRGTVHVVTVPTLSRLQSIATSNLHRKRVGYIKESNELLLRVRSYGSIDVAENTGNIFNENPTHTSELEEMAASASDGLEQPTF